MIKWIKANRTWTLFLIISFLGVAYLGYVNVWEPIAMIEGAKEAAGETVNYTKGLFDFITSDKMIDFIKSLTPILLPIITWRMKSKMDNKVKEGANVIVRDKMGIKDRRKNETAAQAAKYKEKRKRSKKK